MLKSLLLITIAALVIAAPAMASWNYAADWGGTQPSGAWNYGAMNVDGTGFIAYNTYGNDGTNYTWTYNDDVEGYGIPFANMHNPTTNWEPAGMAGMHPSNSGNLSTARWNAPSEMVVHVFGSFQAWRGGSQDVHILHNGASLFSEEVVGWYDPANPADGTIKAFDFTFAVAAGDTVDFGVGYGSDQWYGSGHTGVDATLTEVPEPGSVLALLCGLGGFAGLLRKRA